MTTRPIWNGTISFGLVAIPVSLFSGEQAERAHFHLLDNRNNARIHYERVNEITGKKVPWENIVKAYEFEKDNFVIVDEKQLEKMNDYELKTIAITEFVYKDSIDFPFLDKPYFLVPNKGGDKGYRLLLETLRTSGKAAIAKLMIRTKQHIAVVLPYQNILVLNLLRYPDEIRNPEEFYSFKQTLKNKISPAEIRIANQLIESMTTKWEPKKYHNQSHEILNKLINQKIKKGKSVVTAHKASKEAKETGKVLDFMELLKKSLKEKEKKKKTSNRRR